MSTEVFERQMRYFEGSQEFRAITYDPRSHGLSSKTCGGHFYEQHAKDLKALLTELKTERFVLVAWSAGGGTALEYVRLYGAENLDGLVLVDTAPRSRVVDKTIEWGWFGTSGNGDQDSSMRLFSYETLVNRDAVNREFAIWMLEHPSEQNIDFVGHLSSRTPSTVAALLNLSYWFLDNTAQVKSLDGQVPLLYVVREEWQQVAAAWARDNTPTANVVAFGKHMMFWERAGQFNAVLREFLDSAG